MPSAERLGLEPVDRVEVTVVMDNSIDILAGPSEFGARPPLGRDALVGDQLRAEHGYSLAVKVERGGWRESFLYDAGLTRVRLGQDPDVAVTYWKTLLFRRTPPASVM